MVKKFLIDTNVMLDILFKREPFYDHSRYALELIVNSDSKACVSVQSMSDIFYLVSKNKTQAGSWRAIEKMSLLFEIIGITADDSMDVLCSDFNDYEDGLIAFSAKRNGVDAIITRNEKDFFESDLLLINPKEIDKYIGHHVETDRIVIE